MFYPHGGEPSFIPYKTTGKFIVPYVLNFRFYTKMGRKIVLRITGGLDFVHRPVFYKLKT
jgi:hypothetical protein